MFFDILGIFYMFSIGSIITLLSIISLIDFGILVIPYHIHFCKQYYWFVPLIKLRKSELQQEKQSTTYTVDKLNRTATEIFHFLDFNYYDCPLCDKEVLIKTKSKETKQGETFDIDICAYTFDCKLCDGRGWTKDKKIKTN